MESDSAKTGSTDTVEESEMSVQITEPKVPMSPPSLKRYNSVTLDDRENTVGSGGTFTKQVIEAVEKSNYDCLRNLVMRSDGFFRILTVMSLLVVCNLWVT